MLFALAPALLGRTCGTLPGVAALMALTSIAASPLDPAVALDVAGVLIAVGEAVPLI